MTAASATTAPRTDGPHFVLWGRDIQVIIPSRRDPRLRLAAVIITLQVLGQTVLGFKVSVAQILVTVGTCAFIEFGVLLWRDHMLNWPASAMLTGNSASFILRAVGTKHGDWWSFNGIQWFVLAGVPSLLSKYLIRPGGRHVFNPSNVGLVGVLLLGGVSNVFPQYLYWGPVNVPVDLAMAVILGGALWVLKPVRMVPMAITFWCTFAALVGGLAATGRCFVSIWHTTPVCGTPYWLNICTSPELLVFVFYMMSDPMTAPRTSSGRAIYGATTAIVAAALLSFQPSEFGVKLAILASLTVVCALVRVIDRAGDWIERPETRSTSRPHWDSIHVFRRAAAGIASPAIAATIIIAVAAPVDTSALARDNQLIIVERGLGGTQ
jgi:hypothetical protein